MLKVLISDDSNIIRKSLSKLVSQCGENIQVIEADTISDTIEKIKSLRPDILIQDIMMPGGTGFDVMKTVRKQDYKITVIVLTNFASELNRNRSIKEKADYFLDKSDEFAKVVDICKIIAEKKCQN